MVQIKKIMADKKKILIPICSALAVLFVIAIIVIAIFAAQQQNFSSSIVVNYNAKDIDGTAEARIYYGDSIVYFTDDGTKAGNKIISFKKTSDANNFTLKPTQEVHFEKPINYVVFEFIFSCSSKTSGYNAELSFLGIAENITITTLKSATKQPSTAAITGSVSDFDNFTISAEVPQGKMYYVYIKAKVNDDSVNANFSANFSWKLRG